MGRRFDFPVKKNYPKSTNSLECGAAEVAKKKVILKRNMKLPKVLKDILDMFLQGDASNVRLVLYILVR